MEYRSHFPTIRIKSIRDLITKNISSIKVNGQTLKLYTGES